MKISKLKLIIGILFIGLCLYAKQIPAWALETDSNEESASSPAEAEHFCGNVNGDSLTNILDFLIVMRCTHGYLSEDQCQGCDVNLDGFCNYNDTYDLLLHIYKGKELTCQPKQVS